MNRLPLDYQDFLKDHFSTLYKSHRRREDAICQVNKIIESFKIGYSQYDYDDRFLVMRFQCPLLLKGNDKNAECLAVHKIIRIVRELIYQIIRKYDTGHISDIFYDMDMLELDTASFLYLFHENLSCINMEGSSPPKLGQLCVNTLRSFKRDKLYILPLKPIGSPAYSFYSVSYENYMRQQAYPHIQFCSHPVHYFNYMYEIPFCLILDTHKLIAYQRVMRSEQRRLGAPDITIDIGFNEVTMIDNIDGLQVSYCFMRFDEYCRLLHRDTPFNG